MHSSKPIALPTSSGLFGPVPNAGGYVYVTGLSIAETGGSSSKTVVLRDGSSSGEVLLALTAAAGNAATAALTHPLASSGQVYAVVSGSGTLAGSAHIA